MLAPPREARPEARVEGTNARVAADEDVRRARRSIEGVRVLSVDGGHTAETGGATRTGLTFFWFRDDT